MKKINFEKLPMSMNIGDENTKVEQDVKKDFANILYQQGKGIECHALALKIYNSKGEDEYSIEECELIRQTSLSCAPFFIDAINNILNDENNKKSMVFTKTVRGN